MSGLTTDGKEQPGLLVEIFEHVVQSVAYTTVQIVGVALVAFPFTAIMVSNPQHDISGYIFLTMVSWGIIFGQLTAIHDMETEQDMSGVVQFFVTIATFAYYNLGVVFTVIFAIVANSLLGPEAAVTTALILPALDVQASRRNKGFAYILLAIAFFLGEIVEEAYEQIPIRKVISELIMVLQSIERAVPPVAHYLSLNEFTRDRPHR